MFELDPDSLQLFLGEARESMEGFARLIPNLLAGLYLEELTEISRIFNVLKASAKNTRLNVLYSYFHAIANLIADISSYGRKFDKPVREMLVESANWTNEAFNALETGAPYEEKIITHTKSFESLALTPQERQNAPGMQKQREFFKQLGLKDINLEEFKKPDAPFYEINITLEDNIRFRKTRIFVILRALIERDSSLMIGGTIPPLEDLLAERFNHDFSVFIKTHLSTADIEDVINHTYEIESFSVKCVNQDIVYKIHESL